MSLYAYTIYLVTACLIQVKYVLENCKEDMDFFNTWIEKGIIDRLNVFLSDLSSVAALWIVLVKFHAEILKMFLLAGRS